MPHRPLEIVGCPECTAAAEVVGRYALRSTDGPVEHTVAVCVRGHRFTLQEERPVSPGHGGPQNVEGAARRPGEGPGRTSRQPRE